MILEHLKQKAMQDPGKIQNEFKLLLFAMMLALSSAQCKSSVFKLYTDRYLPRHVMKTVLVTSQFECSMMCSREDACGSWNLYNSESGWSCELNNVSNALRQERLLRRDGARFGHRVDVNTTKALHRKPVKRTIYTFTTLGAKGPYGPTKTSGYQGTPLESQVILRSGIQEWVVPHTGTYVIQSRGASGSNGTCGTANPWHRGGLGAKISGKFLLIQGTLLRILVGQVGLTNTYFNDRPGGGGGGSFVTYANNTPIIIAGGGGGGGGCEGMVGLSDGDPGQLGILGSRCNSSAGHGGTLCSEDKSSPVNAGSGAGFLSDGKSTFPTGYAAKSFTNGGEGGTIQITSNGGFGGGGYGFQYAGGGGGYSGGGVWVNSAGGSAGGGGSLNTGLDQTSGYNDVSGDGLIDFVFLG